MKPTSFTSPSLLSRAHSANHPRTHLELYGRELESGAEESPPEPLPAHGSGPHGVVAAEEVQRAEPRPSWVVGDKGGEIGKTTKKSETGYISSAAVDCLFVLNTVDVVFNGARKRVTW